jgi:aryl-alcohol dehydrogenase-like predicted oxidoreductase
VERRQLGKTGMSVPVIGMGTWRSFDTSEDRRPLVNAALDAGIDLFDTSPMYGRAEAVLAKSIAGKRDQVLIASKVWTSDPEEGRKQAEYALRLFGHVDVYQVHNLVNVPAQLALLEELKQQGKVRAVGATHYLDSALRDMARLMSTGRIEMIQVPYNPLRRAAEEEVLPLAESLGLGVFVLSPLQDGILRRRPTSDELKELGVDTWAQAVLKWIASDRRVSAVLTATSKVEHLRESARAGVPPFFNQEHRDLVVRIASR